MLDTVKIQQLMTVFDRDNKRHVVRGNSQLRYGLWCIPAKGKLKFSVFNW